MPQWLRRVCCAWIVFVLTLLAVPPTVAAADSIDPTADRAYDASFDPAPTGDAFLDQHLSAPAGTPNGTVLSARPVSITPPLSLITSFVAWQVQFTTTAADGRPITSVATIMKPTSWNGRLVANNYAVDGIGLECNQSYQLIHSITLEVPDITRQLLSRGYAVVITDYQGPHMAYAHGPTEGREVLDGIRAALRYLPAGLAGSPVAMTGYSGGAIATVWAAQLQPTYAPELRMVGAAAGGTPADLSLLPATMDGKPPAAGLFLLAALGIARVTPGALELLNPFGVGFARQFKDTCVTEATIAGLAPLPLRALSKVDPYRTAAIQRVFRNTKAGGLKPTMPVYLWHGAFDEWIPLAGVQALYQSWRAAGAPVSLDVLPCDHITCAFSPGGLDHIDKWMGR